MPKYVIFLFKRFDYVNQRKISNRINYPESLFLQDQFNPNGTYYSLTGTVIHTGGLSGGHYTAVGYKDGRWYYFNDARFKEINKRVALEKDPYILFYRREE